MCIICLEFQRNRDLADARNMIAAARREPNTIPESHLRDVEDALNQEEESAKTP